MYGFMKVFCEDKVYSRSSYILKSNNLKDIHDLYSQPLTGILPERTYFTSTEGASVHLSLCWSGRFVHHSMANECFMLISSEIRASN
jgi:hypothetical protein